MNWKDLGRKLLFPKIWVIVVFAILSAVALIMIFVKGLEASLIAYPIYVFSFYSLTILCILCWKTIPNYYKNVKGKVYENQYANRYLTDTVFKTHVNLYSSLIINLLYVAIKAVSSVIYHTYWFAIFAIYYAIMAVMRFLLVRYVRKNQIGGNRLGELKCARICSYILMTVNLALSGAVLMMLYFDRGFEYRGFLIYVIALYTFYTTTNTIINMIKYRKYRSPVMSVSKIIQLASALFSMLFLETAMFSQFGADTSEEVKRIMIMATGGGISVIVVAMAVYMIVRTTKEIREAR